MYIQRYAQNPLNPFHGNFPVDGEVANLLRLISITAARCVAWREIHYVSKKGPRHYR